MPITIRAFANADQAFVLWRPAPLDPAWVGFALDRRNEATQAITPINNRIPPTAAAAAQGAGAALPAEGVSSTASPIRRCAWMDFGLNEGDRVSYRVTPMVAAPGGFKPVAAAASPWSDPITATAAGTGGLAAYFNRGQIMSQIVSRLVGGDVTTKSLKALIATLGNAGSPARRYLSGQARHALLDFMAAADNRGSDVYAALYEFNDPELIEGLKAFGARGHVLIGNGGATPAGLGDTLTQAGLEVHHRDLSKKGLSSPSVHNKFMVEVDSQGHPVRVLTGSTNWTITGLCTQLNNVLLLPRPAIAERYRAQWDLLVAAGDDMTDDLLKGNPKATVDGETSLTFAASVGRPDLNAVQALIDGAKQGCLFLMFMPGASPLLEALLQRSQEPNGPYIRGVVSDVTNSADGNISTHDVTVVGAGDPAKFVEGNDIIMPQGVKVPGWAQAEFDRKTMFAAGLRAIVHSKTIVIDPFSDDCVVVTGSHNFSVSASERNDENLVIVRGDRALAERYAVHIQGVYDAFAWRAFLSEGGASDAIYKDLDEWTKGKKAAELSFWMDNATSAPAAMSMQDVFSAASAAADLDGDPDFGGRSGSASLDGNVDPGTRTGGRS